MDMLNAMGVALYYSGNFTEAVKYYSMAYAAADSLGLSDQQGYMLNNIGVIYRLQGRYERALEIYQKSLRLKKALGDSAGIVNSLYNIGLAYSFMERFEQSLETFVIWPILNSVLVLRNTTWAIRKQPENTSNWDWSHWEAMKHICTLRD